MVTRFPEELSVKEYNEFFHCPNVIQYKGQNYRVDCPEAMGGNSLEAHELSQSIGAFFEDSEGVVHRLIYIKELEQWTLGEEI